MVKRLRRRVYEILEGTEAADGLSRAVQIFLMSIIVLNVAAVMLETEEPLAAAYRPWFRTFEAFSVVVFTIEYLLRLWVVRESARYAWPVLGRVRYAFTPFALIDLAAILPAYLPMLLPLDLRFLRALRLLRLARLLKAGRYSRSIRTVVTVLRERKEELTATLMVFGVMLIVAAGLMYFAERDAQPQLFSSIPASLWWAVVTLTSVGYGDVYPVTVLGKVLAGIIAVVGIGLYALPTAILGAAFVEHIRYRWKRHCPHCGKPLDEHPDERR